MADTTSTVAGVEHLFDAQAAQHGASGGRGIGEDHLDTAAPQREVHADPDRVRRRG